jgi:hypothetical protein
LSAARAVLHILVAAVPMALALLDYELLIAGLT